MKYVEINWKTWILVEIFAFFVVSALYYGIKTIGISALHLKETVTFSQAISFGIAWMLFANACLLVKRWAGRKPQP